MQHQNCTLKTVNDLFLSLDDGHVSLLALSNLSATFDNKTTTDYSTDFTTISEYKERP